MTRTRQLAVLSLFVFVGCSQPEPDCEDPVTIVDDDDVTDDDDATPDDDDTTPPDDDDATGDDDDVTPPNQPPSAPSVYVLDATPSDPLDCVIDGASVDPDGDDVTYRIQWLVDGLPGPVGVTRVNSDETNDGEVWTCSVTPNDGVTDGPAGTFDIELEFGDTPPTTPVIEILPGSPGPDDNLNCVIVSPSIDPDGGSISYTFEWLLDGNLQPITVSEVAFSQTATGQEWTLYGMQSSLRVAPRRTLIRLVRS